MSSRSIDEICMTDARNLQLAWQTGLVGPIKDYNLGYLHYLSAHNIRETQVAVALGKKYKETKPAKYSQVFPHIEDYAALSEGSIEPKKTIAYKFAAMLMNESAPEHLKERLRDGD